MSEAYLGGAATGARKNGSCYDEAIDMEYRADPGLAEANGLLQTPMKTGIETGYA